MKIRNKIALIFVLQIAVLELLMFSLIYFLAYSYNNKEFFDRLGKRTSIAAQSYLEKDEVNAEIYNDIRIKHLQQLPEEKEYFFPEDTPVDDILKGLNNQVQQGFIDQLTTDNKAQRKKGAYFYSGFLYGDNQGTFIVILSARDLESEGNRSYLLKILFFLFLISLAILFILGGFFAQRTLSPIADIIEKAKSIRASSLDKRLTVSKNKDELTELALTFNGMLDRIETSFEMQNNFINNASHELKNPLTAILGQTEIALLKSRDPEAYEKFLHNIENEAHRLDALINVLLSFAKTDQAENGLLISNVRIDEILMEVYENMNVINPENQIELDLTDVPNNADLLMVHGNAGLIKVAISNILDNACKFSDNNRVVAKIISSEFKISLIVTDQGVGIPPEELNNIRQPFYRAKNARSIKGFGFGLSLSNKIMKMHEGVLEIFSENEKGSIVKLIFPNSNSIDH